MKKSVKIAISILMLVITVMTLSSNVFAYDGFDTSKINPNADTTAAGKLQNAGNEVLGVLVWAALIIGGIMLVVIGIKYMIGSAEQKAEYKKTLIPFAVGMLLVVGAVSIVGWLFSINIAG